MKKIAGSLDSHGPKPGAVRVIPASNGLHVWARRDLSGYRWMLESTEEIDAAVEADLLEDGSQVPGGLLRNYGTTPMGGYHTDLQFSVGGRRVAGAPIPHSNCYCRTLGTSGDWKPAVEQWLNAHRPGSPNAIDGSLRRGKVFHLWVRREGRCNWRLHNLQMPSSATSATQTLSGTIKTLIGDGRLVPIGFNDDSPQHLWSIQRTLPASWMKPW